MTFTRSPDLRSRPMDDPARYACPCRKHVTGFAIEPGTTSTLPAVSRVQSAAPATQIRMTAVSTAGRHATLSGAQVCASAR